MSIFILQGNFFRSLLIWRFNPFFLQHRLPWLGGLYSVQSSNLMVRYIRSIASTVRPYNTTILRIHSLIVLDLSEPCS
jgi:hypothetical protein